MQGNRTGKYEIFFNIFYNELFPVSEKENGIAHTIGGLRLSFLLLDITALLGLRVPSGRLTNPFFMLAGPLRKSQSETTKRDLISWDH